MPPWQLHSDAAEMIHGKTPSRKSQRCHSSRQLFQRFTANSAARTATGESIMVSQLLRQVSDWRGSSGSREDVCFLSAGRVSYKAEAGDRSCERLQGDVSEDEGMKEREEETEMYKYKVQHYLYANYLESNNNEEHKKRSKIHLCVGGNRFVSSYCSTANSSLSVPSLFVGYSKTAAVWERIS